VIKMGAICKICKKDMLKANGCIKLNFEYADGKSLPPIKFGEDGREGFVNENGRCHDCGCKIGYYHHSGCDVEICPRCKLQAIGCDCELAE
jgi:hypothetical protein